MRLKKGLLTFIAGLTLLTLPTTTRLHAQDEAATPLIGYYLAADSGGVQQVYQLVIDPDSTPRQITQADNDVQTFGASYDGLSVAYISDGQLWLQSIHHEKAEVLAPLIQTESFTNPVYSPDGQFIAYADNGVWLFDLSTRETRLLIENIHLNSTNGERPENINEARWYTPKLFVVGEDGHSSYLVVNVGIWEGLTTGVYNFTTGTLQEFAADTRLHDDMLPLSDGRVFLFGHSVVAGEASFHMADSLDDLTTYTKIFDFSALPSGDGFMIEAAQAAEIAPGVVRVFGQALGFEAGNVYFFDFNVDTNTAGEVYFYMFPSDRISHSGPLSHDGTLVPIYLEPMRDEQDRSVYPVSLFDLWTGTILDVALPDTMVSFRWQPQP